MEFLRLLGTVKGRDLDYKYTVYGKTNCTWCSKATDLLDSLGLPYSYIPLDIHRERLVWFKEIRGFTTVPQVFLGDTHIGGYTELKEYLSDEL